MVSGLAAATEPLAGRLTQGRLALEMLERALAGGNLRAQSVAGDDAFRMSPSFSVNYGLVDLLMKAGTSGISSLGSLWLSAKAVIHPLKPSALMCRVILPARKQGAQELPAWGSPRNPQGSRPDY